MEYFDDINSNFDFKSIYMLLIFSSYFIVSNMTMGLLLLLTSALNR
jgi:hypothetical protein